MSVNHPDGGRTGGVRERSGGPEGPRLLAHVPALDGIRGIAVSAVVLTHLTVIATGDTWLPPGGSLGVDVFMVLSGFLITALLLRERATTGRIRFGGFFARRAARLLPALALLLAAHAVWASQVGVAWPVERSSLLAAAFFYFNWEVIWHLNVAPGLGHLWSLSVEEQFYLVWPGAVAALTAVRRRTGARLAIGLLVVAVVFVAVRRYVLFETGTPFLGLYTRTDTRADALLVGALLAYLWTHRLTPRGRPLATAGWLAAAFAGWCVWTTSWVDPVQYRGLFTVFAVAVAVVMLAVLDAPHSLAARMLGRGPLAALGRVSYGVYLWHLAIFTAVNQASPTWHPSKPFVALGLTAVAVAASWFLVERPVLRWSRARRRTVPERAEAVSPVSFPVELLAPAADPPRPVAGGAPT